MSVIYYCWKDHGGLWLGLVNVSRPKPGKRHDKCWSSHVGIYPLKTLVSLLGIDSRVPLWDKVDQYSCPYTLQGIGQYLGVSSHEASHTRSESFAARLGSVHLNASDNNIWGTMWGAIPLLHRSAPYTLLSWCFHTLRGQDNCPLVWSHQWNS